MNVRDHPLQNRLNAIAASWHGHFSEFRRLSRTAGIAELSVAEKATRDLRHMVAVMEWLADMENALAEDDWPDELPN